MIDQASPQPVTLARLTSAQAVFGRCLGQRPLTLTLALPDERLDLRLQLAADLGSEDAPPTIGLGSEAGRLWLEVDTLHLGLWLRPWIGEMGLDELPSSLASAALKTALSPLIDALDALLATRFAVMDPPTPGAAIDFRLDLRRNEDEPQSRIARIGLDEQARARLLSRLEQAHIGGSARERWTDLPLTLTPWLGALDLRVSEWRDLAVGDVLLLPRGGDMQSIPLLLRQGQRVLALTRLTEQGILVDRLVSTPMSDQESNASDDAAAIDPDELEVKVDFELGALHLPLRDLGAIAPGYCFELTDLDRPRVRLVVNGRLIGHGDLVMIEDHLGVRVSDLFDARSPE